MEFFRRRITNITNTTMPTNMPIPPAAAPATTGMGTELNDTTAGGTGVLVLDGMGDEVDTLLEGVDGGLKDGVIFPGTVVVGMRREGVDGGGGERAVVATAARRVTVGLVTAVLTMTEGLKGVTVVVGLRGVGAVRVVVGGLTVVG
eukprot:CAMPEP_0184364470 /NCGR_PEP_ID=MMETSP1089-20130417/144442_1 /TAXON_ID=38269 ORGANISM="Gloeochaete wittrockiana, Strain SAG46.84" /NCGR_SAMPLE_ID=MMETSP1089 /ASSEMBLY_ACC=CAM_ASM_000445 /LENGTH=145 /DNA_ID=CAMNT_0026705359 /DNA_START=370 /DNA_END=803 /DNA_ORIENTATION=+